MDAHFEIRTGMDAIYVNANGAEMVFGKKHPMYIELKILADHLIRSASRNTRRGAANTLTIDDLIIAARERVEQLEAFREEHR